MVGGSVRRAPCPDAGGRGRHGCVAQTQPGQPRAPGVLHPDRPVRPTLRSPERPQVATEIDEGALRAGSDQDLHEEIGSPPLPHAAEIHPDPGGQACAGPERVQFERVQTGGGRRRLLRTGGE